MASISLESSTTGTLSVRLTGLSTEYNQNTRTVSWYLNGSYKGQVTLANKVSRGGDFTFTGLSAGTTYTVKAVISGITGSSNVTLTDSFTTDEPTASIQSVSTSSSSITVRLTDLDSSYSGAKRTITWYLDSSKYGTQTLSNGVSRSSNYTFSGLEPNTRYNIYATVSTSSWSISVQSINERTDSVSASIQSVSTASNSITVRLTNLDSGYNSATRTVKWYINGSYSGSQTLSNGVSNGSNYTFTGLNPETRYTIYATVSTSSWSVTISSTNITTLALQHSNAGFYVRTSSGWQRCYPYIKTSSGWTLALPRIKTSSGWYTGSY